MKHLKKIKELWDKLPFWVRDYTISSVVTFVATFLLIVSVQIDSNSGVAFTYASASGIVAIAFRAATRAFFKSLIPALNKYLKK